MKIETYRHGLHQTTQWNVILLITGRVHSQLLPSSATHTSSVPWALHAFSVRNITSSFPRYCPWKIQYHANSGLPLMSTIAGGAKAFSVIRDCIIIAVYRHVVRSEIRYRMSTRKTMEKNVSLMFQIGLDGYPGLCKVPKKPPNRLKWKLKLWVDSVGFLELYTTPGTHPNWFGTSGRHFSPCFSCWHPVTDSQPHDEIRWDARSLRNQIPQKDYEKPIMRLSIPYRWVRFTRLNLQSRVARRVLRKMVRNI